MFFKPDNLTWMHLFAVFLSTYLNVPWTSLAEVLHTLSAPWILAHLTVRPKVSHTRYLNPRAPESHYEIFQLKSQSR